ncbi:LBP / BPI / CETP family protein [Ancylostoma caninum]|uniref:LBP / BPI / CETP family protein n=1 Tax=Ancylostoma caninum TaxID=29170 RepID=A0A368G8X6_ANCCA|nr:LBP / BPI / CETP family protein [Ancylostoma caninum]
MFQWSMSKMHIRAAGEFQASIINPLLLTVPISGYFEALLGHVALTISVRLERSWIYNCALNRYYLCLNTYIFGSNFGSPQVRSALCQSTIGYVDLNVRNTGVITDFFINAFKAFLIAHFKPQVEQRMCRMIETIINQDMNRLLTTMPLKVRINENDLDIIGQTFGIAKVILLTHLFCYRNRRTICTCTYILTIHQFTPTRKAMVGFKMIRCRFYPLPSKQPKSKLGQQGLKNFTLIHFVQNLREKNLLLDYQLTADPFVQNGAIAMLAKGEISWRGNGGTPFYPPNVRVPFPHGVHMVEFYATDYIANSMLYHAYKQHLMDVIVGPESSPQLKDLLFTSCGTGFCIGEFLGALGDQYPNRQVEVVFTARKAPLIVFVENRARFRLHGRMNMFVRPNNPQQVKEMIIRSDTTMTANVNMWINGTRIVGNATIENLDFKLLETKINDVDQASFGDLGLFGAEFLEKLLTEILQLGITMPSMQGVQLKSPRLSFHERYLRVVTYFKLDERFTGDLVRTAVRQTLSHVG